MLPSDQERIANEEIANNHTAVENQSITGYQLGNVTENTPRVHNNYDENSARIQPNLLNAMRGSSNESTLIDRLDALPNELLLEIFQNLSVEDIENFWNTSKAANRIANKLPSSFYVEKLDSLRQKYYLVHREQPPAYQYFLSTFIKNKSTPVSFFMAIIDHSNATTLPDEYCRCAVDVALAENLPRGSEREVHTAIGERTKAYKDEYCRCAVDVALAENLPRGSEWEAHTGIGERTKSYNSNERRITVDRALAENLPLGHEFEAHTGIGERTKEYHSEYDRAKVDVALAENLPLGHKFEAHTGIGERTKAYPRESTRATVDKALAENLPPGNEFQARKRIQRRLEKYQSKFDRIRVDTALVQSFPPDASPRMTVMRYRHYGMPVTHVALAQSHISLSDLRRKLVHGKSEIQEAADRERKEITKPHQDFGEGNVLPMGFQRLTGTLENFSYNAHGTAFVTIATQKKASLKNYNLLLPCDRFKQNSEIRKLENAWDKYQQLHDPRVMKPVVTIHHSIMKNFLNIFQNASKITVVVPSDIGKGKKIVNVQSHSGDGLEASERAVDANSQLSHAHGVPDDGPTRSSSPSSKGKYKLAPPAQTTGLEQGYVSEMLAWWELPRALRNQKTAEVAKKIAYKADRVAECMKETDRLRSLLDLRIAESRARRVKWRQRKREMIPQQNPETRSSLSSWDSASEGEGQATREFRESYPHRERGSATQKSGPSSRPELFASAPDVHPGSSHPLRDPNGRNS